MAAHILRGNALTLPLADNTVDLICTSPPYFALRSYTDDGQHYAGQLGSEPTPAAYVDVLIAATAEMVRVLKPAGSIWVNLGDKYDSGTAAGRVNPGTVKDGQGQGWNQGTPRWTSGRPKSLMGIPWRYALACIDQLGLILRAEIIWAKPNGLPESVTDRVRRSHEQWFWFQQSAGETVEPGPQGFPLCTVCGCPADARATLVSRLHELDGNVQGNNLADHVRADVGVQDEHPSRSDQPGMVSPGGTPVPFPVVVDAEIVEGVGDLSGDRLVSVVDHHAQVGDDPVSPVAEADAAFAVDDPGQPRAVCRCSHPLIVAGEPWLPQSFVADLMQSVADGDLDPKRAADYLAGGADLSHEVWFHLVKQPRYYSAVDEIREDAQQARPQAQRAQQLAARHGLTTAHRDALLSRGLGDTGRSAAVQSGTGKNTADVMRLAEEADAVLGGYAREFTMTSQSLGKLPGSVWTIPTQPLTVPPHLGVDHFAAFPMEFPRRIIRGWSPPGICTVCGEGRRPVAAVEYTVQDCLPDRRGASMATNGTGTPGSGQWDMVTRSQGRASRSSTITGYVCACPTPDAPTRPAVILDPFGGTGTTALVADTLGRTGITLDMSADYNRIAQWRTTDPGQRAAALQVDKPAPVMTGQGDLFGGTA